MPTGFGACQAINRLTAKKKPEFAPILAMSHAAHCLGDSTQGDGLAAGNPDSAGIP